MYRSRRFLPFLLSAVAAMTVACQKQSTTTGTTGATPQPTASPPAQSTSGNLKACDTLEPADLADALGGGNFKEEPDPNDPTFCVWSTGGNPAIQVTISLSGPAYAEGNRTSFDGYAQLPGAETVTGLGEKAVWLPSDGTMYVLHNDTIVVVIALEGSYQDVELIKKVAAKAITNV